MCNMYKPIKKKKNKKHSCWSSVHPGLNESMSMISP